MKEITDNMLRFAIEHKSFRCLDNVWRSDKSNIRIDYDFKNATKIKYPTIDAYNRMIPNSKTIIVIGEWIGKYKMGIFRPFKVIEHSEQMRLADALNIAKQRFDAGEHPKHDFYLVSVRSVVMMDVRRIKRNQYYERMGSTIREE